MATTRAAIVPLILTTAGAVPTIPSPPNLAFGEPGFNPASDLMIGQQAYNVVDKRWFHRSIVGIEVDANFNPALLQKLNGIEANANNYQHPSTHSLAMITDSLTHVKMTVAERSKLASQPTTPVTSVNGQTGEVTIWVPEPLPDSYGLHEVLFTDYTTQHISSGGRFLIRMDKTNAQLETRRTPDLVDGFNTKYVTLNMPAPNPGLFNQLEFFISCVHDTELLTRANAIRHIQLGNTDFDLGKLKVVDDETAAELFEFGESGFRFGHGAYLHCVLRRYTAVGETDGATSGAIQPDYGRFFYDDVNEVWNFSSSFHKYQLVVLNYYEGIFAE